MLLEVSVVMPHNVPKAIAHPLVSARVRRISRGVGILKSSSAPSKGIEEGQGGWRGGG